MSSHQRALLRLLFLNALILPSQKSKPSGVEESASFLVFLASEQPLSVPSGLRCIKALRHLSICCLPPI
jgi:hypothetical protein